MERIAEETRDAEPVCCRKSLQSNWRQENAKESYRKALAIDPEFTGVL